jgi:hypothetical protein
MKRIFLLMMLSLALSTAIFFVNSAVIRNTLWEKLSEIVVLAVPIFIFMLVLSFTTKAALKVLSKKKPLD